MDARTLRDVFGCFATGVTVVTCAKPEDGTAHGATVTAFTPISLNPPLCQVSLTRTSNACRYLEDQPFAVNVLASDQLETAWHFAGRPQHPAPVVTPGPLAPVLDGAAATIVCRPWASYDGGDHILFLGEIVEATVADVEPLLFHRSAFKHIGPRRNASAWTGSLDDPHTGWFDADTTFRTVPLLTQTPA